MYGHVFDAYEIEGHGYYWELFRNGGYVATIDQADGGGFVGRQAVWHYATTVDPSAVVKFHTFVDWLDSEEAKDR